MEKVLVYSSLPKEKIENVRFLYVVIDSKMQIHYEFNNKGQVISPFNLNELNPLNIYRNLPRNLITKSTLQHKQIIGVLQLWIYYTKGYSYGHLRGLGILPEHQGSIKVLLKLLSAMDQFCKSYRLRFVETVTSVIPQQIMKRYGFEEKPVLKWTDRFGAMISGQKMYLKKYSY